MKESFVIYVKYLDNIETLNMEQRGVLFTALMRYVSDQDPPEMDGITAMAFSFIKSQIDEDTKKYEEKCRKRAEAGKLGGRPKEAKKANGFEEKQIKAKKANGYFAFEKNPDNDNEYDNEYDNDIKEKNIIKKEKANAYTCAFESLWSAYPRKKEKAKAYKCYKARLADGFSEDELLLAVKRYADECKRNHTDERYIKLGATFLGPNTPFWDYLEGGVTGDAERETRELTLSEQLRREAENYEGDFDGFDESYDR